jgi:hypothetical protein
MLRITRLDDDPRAPCLRLEGRIVGEWVSVLEAELSRDDLRDRPVVLDLSRVDFATAPAVTVLRRAAESGATLTGCSPLIASLLGGYAS